MKGCGEISYLQFRAGLLTVVWEAHIQRSCGACRDVQRSLFWSSYQTLPPGFGNTALIDNKNRIDLRLENASLGKRNAIRDHWLAEPCYLVGNCMCSVQQQRLGKAQTSPALNRHAGSG